MKHKFVQIASLVLSVSLLLSVAVIADGDNPPEGAPDAVETETGSGAPGDGGEFDLENPGEGEEPDPDQPGEGEEPDPGQPGEGEEPAPGQPGEGEEPAPGQPGEGEEPDPGQPGEGEEPDPGQPGEGEDPDPGQPGEGEEPAPGQPGEGEEPDPNQPGEGEDPEPPYIPPEELYGIGAKVMRLGIYYGASGKKSIDLKLVSGDGFLIGSFDSKNRFTQAPDTEPILLKSITVAVDTKSYFGFVVKNTATGKAICTFDDRGLGTGMAVLPFSLTGERSVTTCGYRYYGSFRFERFLTNNELMTIVNYVYLDDYVKGVVPYEMSPSWPVEALKAQAVAARTYALTRINVSHQNTYHFDLCDSTHCQAYKGVYSGSYIDRVNEAVDSTSGLTVQYDGKYCQTVYSSSDGGASESNVNVFGSEVPYLVGKYDPYEALVEDKINKYRWSIPYTGAELQEKLAADYSDPGLIVDVKTVLSDTGNVIALTFIDENGRSFTKYNYRCRTYLSLRSQRYEVSSDTGETVRSDGPEDTNGALLDLEQGVPVIDGNGEVTIVNDVYLITAEDTIQLTDDDYFTSITTTGSEFYFNGSGWGHNVGMSQWGAYSMAQLGLSYIDILQFYYTGVTIA